MVGHNQLGNHWLHTVGAMQMLDDVVCGDVAACNRWWVGTYSVHFCGWHLKRTILLKYYVSSYLATFWLILVQTGLS